MINTGRKEEGAYDVPLLDADGAGPDVPCSPSTMRRGRSGMRAAGVGVIVIDGGGNEQRAGGRCVVFIGEPVCSSS